MKTSTCLLVRVWILQTCVYCGTTAPREASMLVTQHPPFSVITSTYLCF